MGEITQTGLLRREHGLQQIIDGREELRKCKEQRVCGEERQVAGERESGAKGRKGYCGW
jgi:hypothetical protein